MAIDLRTVRIGRADKHDAFVQRNKSFFERMEQLLDAEEVIFGRTLESDKVDEVIIFYSGIRCAEDFIAITLLAAHGFGLDAIALVRGMFERAVTAAYLHLHPDEAQAFADFDIVQRHRAAQAISETLGVDAENEAGFAELRKDYQEVKKRFEVTDCSDCGTKRVGPSWSKLDFVSMAKGLPQFRELVVEGYYIPLSQAHSTLKSVTALLDFSNGEPEFRKEHRVEADRAFQIAHRILIRVMQTQAEHFPTSAIREAVERSVVDYHEIWPDEKRLDQTGAA